METEREHAIGLGNARGDRPSSTLSRVVRRAWLGAATASAGHDREGPAGPRRPADRSHRRRQDPGGLPALADRAVRTGTAQHPGRSAHPLHLSAQGPGGRYRAQPGHADPRDGAEDRGREPHRRHRRGPQAAPAPATTRHPADHARATGPVLRLGGRAGLLRRSVVRDHRRGPRHLAVQARRPVGPGAGAAATVRAEHAARGAVGDGG